MNVFFSGGLLLLAALSVQVSWTHSPSPEVLGYVVVWGPAPRTYNESAKVGYVTNATLAQTPGTIRYFSAYAYSSNATSDFTNEVVWTNKPAAPIGLRRQ